MYADNLVLTTDTEKGSRQVKQMEGRDETERNEGKYGNNKIHGV